MLTPLNLPQVKLKLTQKGEKLFVWDDFRMKQVVLTPEEWVRQHFLHFLVNDKAVPKNLIAVEQGIQVNTLTRRCDAVIYNREGAPLAIVECKAPEIALTEKTLHQIAQYNFKLRVNYLILTNGIQTVVAFVNMEKKTIEYLEEVPRFFD
jgi:type I site-specific restriction-modification system R (restriction) subunit